MDSKVIENILLSDKTYAIQKEYWQEKLNECKKTTLLNKRVESVKDLNVVENCFEIQNEIFQGLKKISKGKDLTLYIILLSILKAILYRYTEKDDIAVWSPVYMQKCTEKTINDFIVIRDSVDGKNTLKNIIMNVKKSCIEGYNNQDFPLRKFVEEEIEAEIVCSLNTIHDSNIKEYPKESVVLAFERYEDKLDLKVKFNSNKYTTLEIERFVKNYEEMAKNFTKDINLELSNTDCVANEEIDIIENKLNNTQVEHCDDKLLNEIFENKVLESPDKIAVVFGDNKLTYDELNKKANKLARQLNKLGIKAKDIVGIMMDKSEETIIAMLAILKAGAAYLPLGIDYPIERVLDIKESSNLEFIIRENLRINRIEGDKYVEVDAIEEINNCENLEKNISPNDLAYVIYTSGSTGKPKGVMVEHRNVVNVLEWFNSLMDAEVDCNVLQLTNITFDVSVEEIFGAILFGRTLFIPDKETRLSYEKLRSYIEENNINIAQFVPVTLREFLVEGKKIECLNKVVCGGDKLDDDLKNKIVSKGYNLYNNYGPTETTVDAISLKCSNEKVTLGKPIDNTNVYIVNELNKLQPIGAIGEICIAGKGVTRGYMNNEKLTAEKFIINPFGTGKLYKTGDLGRWLEDGTVEFWGRVDNQVKIRGFRIEIGEIENLLKSYSEIKEAVVVVEQDKFNNKSLCAYFEAAKILNVEEIKKYLLSKLPSYMVPTYLVQIDKMPLKSNGKIDTKQLSRKKENINSSSNIELPRNYIEEQLVEVWKNILGSEEISISSDFFELGGDSIKALQIVSSSARKGLKLEVKDIFEKRTIKELSPDITFKSKSNNQESVEGPVKLSPIQKWFFEQNFTNSNHWNNSMMIFSKDGFKLDLVKKVVNKIVEHHDALRMVYDIKGESVLQTNLAYKENMIDVEAINLRDLLNYKAEIEKECDKIQSNIDLNNGPLINVKLFNTIDGDYIVFVIHHLVIDGISWRVLLEDFNEGYIAIQEGKEIKLQDKTDSYKEWVDNVYKYSESKKLKRELSYWKEIEDEKIDLIKKDMKADSNKILDSKLCSIKLSKEYTEKFIKDVNGIYNTKSNDILLTALLIALNKWTCLDKIRINLEGHGREMIYPDIDISRTIGWFTTTYPVVLSMEKGKDLSYMIRKTKETLRKTPNNGIGYGILRYISNFSDEENVSFKCNPEIGFNYLGEFDKVATTKTFELSDVSSGIQVSPQGERITVLDINGMVLNNELTFTCNYNTKEYFEETINNLMELFKDNLIEIIDYCTSGTAKQVTPTDLGDANISIDDLDNIMNLLNQ
ncbi:MAG: amino acid adenylation domain-containing protein [Clostridium sp.]|nr:amino acid adenylation domain-containing protein [Clostridium sp.]